jgi:gamma-glutamyl-gamma-aminobutyrate hydrolase PuuD
MYMLAAPAKQLLLNIVAYGAKHKQASHLIDRLRITGSLRQALSLRLYGERY